MVNLASFYGTRARVEARHLRSRFPFKVSGFNSATSVQLQAPSKVFSYKGLPSKSFTVKTGIIEPRARTLELPLLVRSLSLFLLLVTVEG